MPLFLFTPSPSHAPDVWDLLSDHLQPLPIVFLPHSQELRWLRPPRAPWPGVVPAFAAGGQVIESANSTLSCPVEYTDPARHGCNDTSSSTRQHKPTTTAAVQAGQYPTPWPTMTPQPPSLTSTRNPSHHLPPPPTKPYCRPRPTPSPMPRCSSGCWT
jgi:hypothetical protein